MAPPGHPSTSCRKHLLNHRLQVLLWETDARGIVIGSPPCRTIGGENRSSNRAKDILLAPIPIAQSRLAIILELVCIHLGDLKLGARLRLEDSQNIVLRDIQVMHANVLVLELFGCGKDRDDGGTYAFQGSRVDGEGSTVVNGGLFVWNIKAQISMGEYYRASDQHTLSILKYRAYPSRTMGRWRYQSTLSILH